MTLFNIFGILVLFVLIFVADKIICNGVRQLGGIKKAFGFVVVTLVANIGYIYIIYSVLAGIFAPEEI